MKKLDLGIVASALSDDPRAAAAAARQAGSGGVGGLQFDAKHGVDLTELSGTGRREFQLMLRNQAQRLIGLRADAGPKGLNPGADVDRLLSRLEKIFETAAGLGSPLVCLEVGLLPAPPAAQVDAALFEIGRRADRFGVIVALRSSLGSIANLRRALDASICPWFGIDLDPVAALHEPGGLDAFFSATAGLIRHVRARDALRGEGHRTTPVAIGQGSVDWPGIISRLDESGYNGWITIDPLELADRRAGVAAGIKVLSRLLNA